MTFHFNHRAIGMRRRGVAAVVLGPLIAGSAAAQSTSFNVSAGAWFFDPNWTNFAPNSGVDAYVTNGGTAQILNLDGNARDVFVGAGTIEVATLSPPNPRVLRSRHGFIGHSGSGSVSVTGTGSSWLVSNDLTVGFGSPATLTIQSGGEVRSARGFVGWSSTGRVTVSGAGSAWNNTGTLDVGHAGLFATPTAGTIEITSGGVVVSDTAFFGTGSLAAGTVAVSGTNSQFIASHLRVGDLGAGTLNILAGGHGGSLAPSIASRSGSTGNLLVSGNNATWISQLLDVGGDIGLNMVGGAGTVTVASGASLSVVDRLRVWNQGTVRYNGGRLQAGTLHLTGGGRVLLASGADKTLLTTVLFIDTPAGSAIDLSDNAMVIDYSGSSPAATVRAYLNSGHAGGNWNGSGLRSSAANASQFGIGYAESSEIFAGFPATFAGVQVDNTAILLRFTRYGDANLDGLVNLADFNRLAANFGSTGAGWAQGDFNYDGIVNLTDFNRLAANFGLSAAGPDVTPQDWADLAAAIPEPGLAVGAVASALLPLRRQRRRTLTRTPLNVLRQRGGAIGLVISISHGGGG